MNTDHHQYSKCHHRHLWMCDGVEKAEVVEVGVEMVEVVETVPDEESPLHICLK